MKRKLSKKQREDRAVETIIACIMRGFNESDWHRVFQRMDQMDEWKKRQEENRHREEHGGDIYGAV